MEEPSSRRSNASFATSDVDDEEGAVGRMDSAGSSPTGDCMRIRTREHPARPHPQQQHHHPRLTHTPTRTRATHKPTQQGNNRRSSKVAPSEEPASIDNGEGTEGDDQMGDEPPIVVRKKRFTLTRNGSVRQDSLGGF